MKKLYFFLILQMGIIYAQESYLIPFMKNNKIGFVDENLHCVQKPQYDSLCDYKDNTFILYFKEKKEYVLLNKLGSQFIGDVILLGDGYYSVYSEPDTYVYDENRKIIRVLSNLQHDHKSTYENMIVYNGGSENIINVNSELIFNDKKIQEIFDYDSKSGIALGRYAGKGYCLISKNGIKNTSQFLFGMRSFNEGLVFGKNMETGECGFYNYDCKLVIKAGIKADSDMDNWFTYPPFSCGVLPFASTGHDIILLSEGQIYHSENWIIIDIHGNAIVTDLTADYIYPFSDDVAVLMLKSNNKWNYSLIDKTGHFLTTEQYDKIYSSVNGYCMAQKGGVDYLIRSKDGQVFKCADFR